MPTALPTPDVFADGALSVKDAVRFFGLSRTRLYRLMRAGDLPYACDGESGTRFIPRKALADFLASLARRAKRAAECEKAAAKADAGYD